MPLPQQAPRPAPGHVNHLARRYQGIVNGLYIALYYPGGGIGSWLAALNLALLVRSEPG